MELEGVCPIHNQILKIIASHNAKVLARLLTILQEIVLSLLSSSSDGTFAVLKKDTPTEPSQILSLEGVAEFLAIVGYHEQNGNYVHEASDENMKILEVASNLLASYISQYEIEGRATESPMSKETSPTNTLGLRTGASSEKSNKKQEKSLLVKDFLDRQSKKDSDFATWRRHSQKACSTDFSFDPEGYFYQSGRERPVLQKKSHRYGLFDEHEMGFKKSYSFNRKKASSHL